MTFSQISDFRLFLIYFSILNNRRAWNDIIRLTGDKSEYIRKKANRYPDFDIS